MYSWTGFDISKYPWNQDHTKTVNPLESLPEVLPIFPYNHWFASSDYGLICIT